MDDNVWWLIYEGLGSSMPIGTYNSKKEAIRAKNIICINHNHLHPDETSKGSDYVISKVRTQKLPVLHPDAIEWVLEYGRKGSKTYAFVKKEAGK